MYEIEGLLVIKVQVSDKSLKQYNNLKLENFSSLKILTALSQFSDLSTTGIYLSFPTQCKKKKKKISEQCPPWLVMIF